MPRRPLRLDFRAVAVILLALIFLLDVASGDDGWLGFPSGLRTSIVSVSSWTSGRSDSGMVCDPYDYNGVLRVSKDSDANVFLPILAPERCRVENWMASLRAGHSAVDFIRNKTVVFFGDSNDRNLNDDICMLSGGKPTMLLEGHPLAPPYPIGQERSPPGYVNDYDGNNNHWPNILERNQSARPHLCHYASHNFRIVNVFHYGFRPATKWLTNLRHFYPPALLEDRFDQILVPLMQNIAAAYGVSDVPDILTFTPGFWTILRGAVDDGIEIEPATTSSEVHAPHNPGAWNPHNLAGTEWLVSRLQSTIDHVASAWSDRPMNKRPLILYRPLAHIPGHPHVPSAHVEALDQIGKAVVRQLQAEGRAARSKQGWAAWTARNAAVAGWKGHSREEALALALDERIVISRWADITMGARGRLRDALHPDVLPWGQLYGNMLLQQLKMLDAERS